MLKQNCCFELGDGDKIRFREEAWCGETPLCMAFPALYAVIGSKGAKVVEVWGESGLGDWNLRFVRSFNDWEMEMIQNLICTVNLKKSLPAEKRQIGMEGDQGQYFYS